MLKRNNKHSRVSSSIQFNGQPLLVPNQVLNQQQQQQQTNQIQQKL